MPTIKSGTLTEVVHFTTPPGLLGLVGLSAFTVIRKRGSNAGVAMTLTAGDIVEEGSTGLCALKADEDMTITGGKKSEPMSFLISAPGMTTQHKEIELRASYDDDVIAAVGAAVAVLEADIAAVAAAIAALPSISDVNAQVLDVLATDVFNEPTGVPAANATLATKLGYVFAALRNRINVAGDKKSFYDAGGSPLWSKLVTDDGTNYSEATGTGP